MLRKVALCLSTSIIFAFASCSSGGSVTATISTGQATVTVTEKDSDTTVVLSRGDILKVELAGNPSTGYQWQQNAANQAILRQVGEPDFSPESPAIGAPGKVGIRFESMQPGQMQLELVYRRPFEPQAPVDKTFKINVSVN